VILDWPDAIWTLTKDADDSDDVDDDDSDANVSGTRFLKATGRDVEMRETALEFDAASSYLTALKEGTGRRQLAWIKRMNAHEHRIMTALIDNDGEIVGLKELEKISGVTGAKIKKPLERLMDDGMVEIAGGGKPVRGKPTTYRLTRNARELTEKTAVDPGEIQPSPGRSVEWLARA